jgi:hypothetical protein
VEIAQTVVDIARARPEIDAVEPYDGARLPAGDVDALARVDRPLQILRRLSAFLAQALRRHRLVRADELDLRPDGAGHVDGLARRGRQWATGPWRGPGALMALLPYGYVKTAICSDLAARLFPTEEPLAHERMIGRESDVQELTTQLAGGVHRIVAAPRRTSKSSVCRAVVAQLRERGCYTVSVSLFRLADGHALARGLAQETLANCNALRRLIQRARGTAGFSLRGTSLGVVLRVKGELGDAVEMQIRTAHAVVAFGHRARLVRCFLPSALRPEIPGLDAQADPVVAAERIHAAAAG